MAFVKSVLGRPYMGILLTLVVLCGLFQLINPAFLSTANMAVILRAMAYPGLIAIGMGLCLISGVMDLSVGATAAFSSVFLASALVYWSLPLWLALVLTVACGALIGLFNSVVILNLHVTPFIATIASMFMVKGLALAWNKGFVISPLPGNLVEVGMARPLGVSWPFWLMVALMVGAYIMLEHSVFGLEIKATGSDYEVAKVTEVRYILVHRVLLAVVGGLAALAGIFSSFMLNSGHPNVGTGWEFAAITACAIGGVSLYGYEGSIFGIFCGLLVVQVLQNGIVLAGVSPYLQTVVVGLVLLVAIALDVRRRRYLNLESL